MPVKIVHISPNEACAVDLAVEAMQHDGAVVLENLMTPAQLDALKRELEPWLAETPKGEGLFYGRATRRMGRLFLKSKEARNLALDPFILGIAERILRPFSSAIQINLTQAIRIEPGEQAQILHADDEFFPFPRGIAEFMLNAMIAIDDFTQVNGATRLVLGSHKQPLDRNPPTEVVSVAEMPRGSVLMYLGSAVHGGGANKSSKARTGAVISYCLGWLRQAENQYLAYPPEVAKTFPPALQRLIGYSIHEPNLGWFEGQDPSIVLNDSKRDFLAARDLVSPPMRSAIERYYATAEDRGL